MTNSIETEFNEGAFSIYFNRPEARNPLDRETRLALQGAFDNLPEGTRVIFLRGRGGVFCAGQDLKEFMANMGKGELDPQKILAEEYEPILAKIEASKVPVIAIVEGACVGAGMSLALACDYIIASETAYFQLSFAKIALSPDVGATYYLPRIVGRSRAMAMALTYEKVDAHKAERFGLVWEVFSESALDAGVEKHANIYREGAPRSFGNIVEMMRGAQDSDLKTQLEIEGKRQAECLYSEDFKEAVTAFFQKRAPNFTGK